MASNQQTYIYLGDTLTLCETCLTPVTGKVIIEDGSVFYLKRCLTHGLQKTLISTDPDYYRWSRRSIIQSPRPLRFQREFEKGCPHDCGLCSDHEQHSCMAILEIIDDCNMRCPTCLADSYPGAGNRKSLADIEHMLDTLVESEGRPDLVMISGGEPTIHPDILEILKRVKARPIKHVMLITNGLRIADDEQFVSHLRDFQPGFEIYLQFDSLRKHVLEDIRGEDLREVRLRALANLESARLPTTLVCVVKKGLNDDELGEIVDFGLRYRCVRGVTFQPVKASGRNETFNKENNYITLSETRTNLLQQFQTFAATDIVPHPCNPENISIGYLLKKRGNYEPVTQLLYPPNEKTTTRSKRFSKAQDLRRMMYFLPELNSSSIKYDRLFRVAIVSFLDQYNFSVDGARRSCIHFVTPDRQIIPLDTYYLFYANRLKPPIRITRNL